MPVAFPSVYVCNSPNTNCTGGGTYALVAGTERSSGANSLDQKILEVTDDFTLIKGNHTITVGTHDEFFKFDNLFVQDVYGTYFFNSITPPATLQPRRRERGPVPGPVRHPRIQSGVPVRRPAVGPLRGRPVAGQQQLHAEPGHPGRSPAAHRQADLQPARLQHLRDRHEQRAQQPADHLAPPRVQLEPERVGQGSGARRNRRLRGPHPVRLDLEQLRQHRHRDHEPERDQRHLQRGSEQPAEELPSRNRPRSRSTGSIPISSSPRSFAARWATTASSRSGSAGASRRCSRRRSRTSSTTT